MSGEHFVEEGWKEREIPFIEGYVYGTFLDTAVFACADVLVKCGDKYLLCKRNVYPQKDWWFIGGRMRPGESPEQTAVRHFKDDTGLEIAPKRLVLIGFYSTCFAMRQLPPQENGTHTLNTTFLLGVTPDEASQIDLTDREYDNQLWLTKEEIISQAEQGKLHPVFLAMMRDIDKLNL